VETDTRFDRLHADQPDEAGNVGDVKIRTAAEGCDCA
jgi:hypothetical protein